MAGSRTGTPTIIQLSRVICRVVSKLGAQDLAAKTSPEFKLAVDALVLACRAFELADDQPGQIDGTSPAGPED